MRSIGNAWSALGQTPPSRRGCQTGLVVVGVAAIAAASAFSSLTDATATNPAASFVQARAMVTTYSPAPTAEENQAAAASPPTILPASRESSASPAKPPRDVDRKSTVWNEREWWKGDRQRRSRNTYWQRSVHARALFPGSISSQR